MLRHWKALTLFLRSPGAPLENNVCERALKREESHPEPQKLAVL
jgi:transposase